MTGLEVLADGLRFGEGPRWHSGKLWFSDMYDHAVKTVDLDGQVQVKVDLPGQPSGLGLAAERRSAGRARCGNARCCASTTTGSSSTPT